MLLGESVGGLELIWHPYAESPVLEDRSFRSLLAMSATTGGVGVDDDVGGEPMVFVGVQLSQRCEVGSRILIWDKQSNLPVRFSASV